MNNTPEAPQPVFGGMNNTPEAPQPVFGGMNSAPEASQPAFGGMNNTPEAPQPMFGGMNNTPQQNMYGMPINPANEMANVQPVNNQMNQQPKKKSVGLIIVLVLLIVAILGAGGFAIYYFTQSDETEEKENDKKEDKEDDEDNDDGGNASTGQGGKVKFLGENFVIPSKYQYQISNDKLTVTSGTWYTQINKYALTYSQLQSVKEEFIAKLNETGSVSDYYNKRLNGYDCFIVEGVINSFNASFIFVDLNSSTPLQITIMNLDYSEVKSSVYDDIMEMLP